MNKYLLEILKEANTIIIPGLGALTITDKEKNEIMFMPYLKHDDGKLSTYIAEKDSIDETEAKNIVAKFVREIQTRLDQGESYDMFEFGTFSKVGGDIEFQAWKTTPAATSTTPTEEKEVKTETTQEKKETKTNESVTPKKETPPITKTEETIKKQSPPPIKPMNIIEKEELSKNVEKLDDLKEKNNPNTISNKSAFKPIETAPKTPSEKVETLRKETKKPVKSTVNKKEKKRGVGFWILSILLVLLIAGGTYFGINYNNLKQYVPFLADKVENESNTTSELDDIQGFLGEDEIEHEESEEANIEEQSEENLTEQDEQKETTPEEEEEEEIIETHQEASPTPQETGASNGAYKVIAGVFSSEENALRLVDKFKDQGLPASTFTNFNGMHVVCMKSFDNSADANAEMSSLKAISPSAWLMHRP
ncbi:MAG: SPOR domain-containing protein [Crocinitomicaceae bacterium]|nr:SPOR domain-containing protein [Crocinitomicaceae bacterium]